MKEVEVGVLEKKKMFTIKKEKPFKFCPQFTIKEDALPIDEQRQHMKKDRDKIDKEVAAMEEIIKGIPFEVMRQSELVEELEKKGVDHFIDPHFPPRD